MLALRNIAARLAKASTVAVCLAASHPAAAQAWQYAYYPDTAVTPTPGPASVALAIPVTASVGGTCGFQTAPNATIFNANIDTTSWSDQVAFVPECTAPWRIAVSSLNGALKSVAPTEAGYTNVAPYDVALHVNSDGGAVDRSCAAAQIDQALVSSTCDFRGTASPSTGLVVPRSYQLAGSYLQVSAPAYPGANQLVEGLYYDTLTVTVSPAT